MRNLILLVLLTLASLAPARATSYFLSPSGSDSNNGLSSGAPWLSPNHAVNCGDTLSAASGTYLSTNFNNGDWGAVSTCSGGNQVAWVICATFDTCKINSTTGTAPGLWIDKSHWGVVGWEVSVGTGVTFGTCFEAGPSGSTNVNHVIFANNIANGCQNGGIITFNNGSSASVDYVAMLGNIAYNAAQGAHSCTSGFSIYQPQQSDTNSGTHIYLAGNFAWANVDPNPCNGTAPTDGEPIILDTFDSSQGGPGVYSQQAVAQNNLGFFNGGRGFEAFENKAGSGNATIVLKYNTAFGNMTDNFQTAGCLGRAELAPDNVKNTTFDHNLAQTRTGTSCMSAGLYALFVETCDSSCTVTNNWLYSAAGNNSGIDASPGFSLGAGNVSGTNPSFANPVNPGAPSCGSFASVPACMATVIADYTPTNGSALAYGRQTVSNTSITDALFPQWLCTGTGQMNSNIPANLVTPGCGVASSSSTTFTGGTITGGVIR